MSVKIKQPETDRSAGVAIVTVDHGVGRRKFRIAYSADLNRTICKFQVYNVELTPPSKARPCFRSMIAALDELHKFLMGVQK